MEKTADSAEKVRFRGSIHESGHPLGRMRQGRGIVVFYSYRG